MSVTLRRDPLEARAAPGGSMTATPSSTRSLTVREMPNSPMPRLSASSPTERPEAMATRAFQRSASTVTCSTVSSGAMATRWLSDGTTASSSRHSSSSWPARRSVASTSLGSASAGAFSSTAKLNDPRPKRSISNTTSSMEGSPNARSAFAATSEPSSIHTCPRPRSPSTCRQPVLPVVANNRSTSGNENVSRVPCRATDVPPID